MTNGSDAGAEVARPTPSRLGGSFDGSRPLQTLLDNLPAARASLNAAGSASFFYGIANLAPKLALGKLDCEKRGDTLVITSTSGEVRVMPLGHPSAQYEMILEMVSSSRLGGAGRTVLNVPKHIAEHLSRTYTKSLQQNEYLIPTENLKKMAGGSLANVRNLISRLKRDGAQIEIFGPSVVDEYLAVNQAWYRENAKTKFRTYDKTSIDWLLNNFEQLASIVPDLMCLGVRTKDGKLLGFTVSSLLCDGVWTAYTERFSRGSARSGANWMLWQYFAAGTSLGARCGFENDGTADTPELKHNKGKLQPIIVPFYRLAP